MVDLPTTEIIEPDKKPWRQGFLSFLGEYQSEKIFGVGRSDS